MQVRMKVAMAAADWAWAPGQEVEVSDHVGTAMCADGRAEPVGTVPAERRETATPAPAEKRARRKK